MKRVLLVLVAVIVFAALGAAGYTWWFLSRFDARAEIERRVEAATGRDCEIKGAVSVTFWPALGFKGEIASLAGISGGSAAHLLTAREVVVGMALKPLMQRRLEVHELILVEPVVSLEVDAQGRPNWILKPVAPSRPQQPARPGARATTFSLHGMRVIDGRFSYANFKTKSAYGLDDVDAKVDLDGMDAPLTLSGEATFRGERATVDLTVGVFRALTTGQATPLKVSITATPFTAALDGALDVKTGGLSGELAAAGPSLRGLAAWAGSPLGRGPGLEAFKISGRVDVGVKRYAFDNASIEIDNVKGRGDFLIEQGARAPFLSGRVEIATLDLNPYLAPRTEQGGVQVASVQQVDVRSPGWSDLPIDLTGLKAVNANLELTTGPLQIQKTRLERTQVSLLLNDGYLIVTARELEMYGGNGTGRFEVDARGTDITIRNELAVQKVDAQRFFTDAFGFANLEGTAKIDWGFSGRGATQKSLMGSLTGDGAFTFQNGALRGVNLGGVGRTIRDAMRGEMVSPTARTPFSTFTATLKAADGVLATRDLQMVAPQARINAIGVIDMGARSIDMRLTPRLSGVAVPFRVSGAWTGIGYASDILGRARPGIEARVRAVQAKASAR